MTNTRGTSRGAVGFAQSLITLACSVAFCGLQTKAAPVYLDSNTAFRHLSQVIPSSSETTHKSLIFDENDVTGNMDAETVGPMTLSRCGVKDIVETEMGRRTKRYVIKKIKWEKQNLTYKISKYASNLNDSEVDEEIARAFAVWSNYTNLNFSQQIGDVDIEISFERGDHGDDEPFDEDSLFDASLAHAFFPEFGGDIHFNDDQDWTVDSCDGSNLFEIAVHEIGHSLGLAHNNITSSVMNPLETPYNPNFELDSDDIAGIQAIYGPKTVKVPQIDRPM